MIVLLAAPGGAFVPLRELADVEQGSGRYGVLHEGGSRIQVVASSP